MKTNRKELMDALSLLRPALVQKETVAQFAFFVFDNGTAYSYNGDIAISVPVDKELRGVVKANELYTLLAKFNDEEITITIEKNEFLVQGKRKQAGIVLKNEIQLPLEELGKPKKWKALPSQFMGAISLAQNIASRNMAKVELTNISIVNDKVIASDGFRIIQCTIEKGIIDNMLLQANSIKDLIKYNPTHFTTTEGWLHFKNKDEVIFSVREGAGDYPDVSKFLNIKGQAVKFPDKLKAALERAEVFSKSLTGLDNPTIEIELTKSKLVIRSRNEIGWFEEKMVVEYDGQDMWFKTDPVSLKEMLPKLKTVCISSLIEGCSTGLIRLTGTNFIYCLAISGKNE